VAGSVGKPTTPGKLGKSGTVRVVSTRPLVAAWDFTNPLDVAMSAKRGHVGYELRVASGKLVQSRRTITHTPNLSPGSGFRVEITLPMNLPPGEYVARFDFRHKDRWGAEMGVKPLEIMYAINNKNQIWVR
jgi:hypothetical protein